MLPDELRSLAASQEGALTRAQVLAAGLSDQRLRRLVRNGQLERRHPSTFAVGGSPRTWRQDLTAALLELGPDALVSHEAAAAVHGFDGFGPLEVHVTIPRPARQRLVGVHVHTTSVLPTIDRARVDGVPCTSPTRTVIDLARRGDRQHLEAALGSALRDGGTSVAFVRRRLGDLRGHGRAGAALLDRVLADGTGAGHSHLERLFLRLLAAADLPRPRCQVVYRRGGTFVARVDVTWEAERIVVEVAGQQRHASPAERQRDAQRHTELQLLGFVVITFTYEDVTERPAWVVDRCSDALELRRPTLQVEDPIGS